MRRWYGQFLGFIAGWMLLRHPVGGFLGFLIGYGFDHDWFSSQRRASSREQQADQPTGNADVDWAYRVFDLPENASDADIDRAYRKLMSQYHPDRVTGAAPEIQKLAEKKSRELNAAYDRIQKLRKK